MENIKRIILSVLGSKKFGNGLIILITLFLSIWSLGNHFLYKTAALDLGLFNKALYDYAHFHSSEITLLYDGKVVDFLGDHFAIIVMLFLPLHYIFGSYALLVIQILFVVVGAVYMRKYILFKTQNQVYANLALLHFFSLWGLYSAVTYDFHTNVLAAMLVPALLYEFEKRSWIKFALFYMLMLLCRENVGFWMGFLLLGFHLKNKFEVLKLKPVVHSLIIVIPILYSVCVASYIIPHINHTVEQAHYTRFQALGHTTGEVAQYVILHPVEVVKLLFTNTTPDAKNDLIKLMLHLCVLASGGILFLLRPAYLFMLMPIYLQKMLGYDSNLWGVNFHYSIEFVPILALLVFDVGLLIQRYRYRIIFYTGFIASSLAVSISVLQGELTIFKQSCSTFLYNDYNSLSLVKATNEVLKEIPEDAIVSAHSNITPHLSATKRLYAFPYVHDAQYILTYKQWCSWYPLNDQQYADTLNYYRQHYALLKETDNLLLFKKR